MLDVRDALGLDNFPVIAVSAGGSYAVALAATAPKRVERLFLVSAQMPYDDDSAIQELQPAQLTLLRLLRAGRSDALITGIEAFRERLLDDPVAAMAPSMETLTDAEWRWFE